MSMPLPTGVELTAVAAVAGVLSIAGMWLTRRATHLIGYGDGTKAHPSLKRAERQPSSPRNPASAFDMPDGPRPASWTRVRDVVLAKLNGIFEYARSSRRTGLRPAQPRIAMHSAVCALPQRLPIDAQWERAASVVNRAVAGARTVRAAHVAASEKLDAAHYALDKLIGELEGIIPRKPSPAKVTILTRTPNVVALRATSAPAARAA